MSSSKDTLKQTVIVALLLCLVLFSQSGCVHRRLTINSSPQGALVRVDGKDVGYTPASLDYTWYGTREVQLLKDGYETQTRLVRLRTPWYQVFPLDFLSDNFAGRYIRDHRRFDFRLQPKTIDDSADVMQRGRSLRSQAVHGL